MALFPAVLERHRRALRVNSDRQLPFECVVRSQTSAPELGCCGSAMRCRVLPTRRNSRPKELHRIVKMHRIFRDDLR